VKHVVRGWSSLTVLGLLVCTGCPKPPPPPPVDQKKNYLKPLPPGEMALAKIDPSEYPDFSGGFVNKEGLEEAIKNSLSYMSKPSSKKYFPYLDVSHERAVASLNALLDVLQQAKSPADLDALIKERFEVYQSKGCDEHRTVLFTGYYRPIFDARLQREGEFKYPLYRSPDNLIKDEEGTIKGMKMPNGNIYKCWSRSQIETSTSLPLKPICWLKDRFEAYIVTVQGSGKLRLADGSFFEIGYAANNGFDYTSIGNEMIKDGALRPEELSLQGLIKHFREHPEQMDKFLPRNQRYVFFTERAGGPWGSLNEPVTPYRSIAVDKAVFPRACPAFFVTQLPTRLGGQIVNQPYSGLAMDQDTGGAIRAAGRCDIFMGTGDEVGELAGRTFAEGQLYYIFVKEGATQPATPAPPLAPGAKPAEPEPPKPQT
jgi:membrane-bound lytic murein transglycosylase A